MSMDRARPSSEVQIVCPALPPASDLGPEAGGHTLTHCKSGLCNRWKIWCPISTVGSVHRDTAHLPSKEIQRHLALVCTCGGEASTDCSILTQLRTELVAGGGQLELWFCRTALKSLWTCKNWGRLDLTNGEFCIFY